MGIDPTVISGLPPPGATNAPPGAGDVGTPGGIAAPAQAPVRDHYDARQFFRRFEPLGVSVRQINGDQLISTPTAIYVSRNGINGDRGQSYLAIKGDPGTGTGNSDFLISRNEPDDLKPLDAQAGTLIQQRTGPSGRTAVTVTLPDGSSASVMGAKVQFSAGSDRSLFITVNGLTPERFVAQNNPSGKPEPLW